MAAKTAKEQGCYEITHENGYCVHRMFKHGEQTTMTFYNEETGQSYICDEVWQFGHRIIPVNAGRSVHIRMEKEGYVEEPMMELRFLFSGMSIRSFSGIFL